MEKGAGSKVLGSTVMNPEPSIWGAQEAVVCEGTIKGHSEKVLHRAKGLRRSQERELGKVIPLALQRRRVESCLETGSWPWLRRLSGKQSFLGR